MTRSQAHEIRWSRGRRLLACAIALLFGPIACMSNLDLGRAQRFLDRPPEPDLPSLQEDAVSADLPSPDGVRALSGELRVVPLRWDPLLIRDVGGYTIERAATPEGPFVRIASIAGAHSTSFIDRLDQTVPGADPEQSPDVATPPPVEPAPVAPVSFPNDSNADRARAGLDAATWYYRVRAFTAEGQLAATPSAVVMAVTAATPEAPGDLRAYSHQPRKVPLSWSASSDPTVSGYRIERSPTSIGPFELVTEIHGRHETTWIDQPLGDLRVFYYRVAAVNSAGGEGSPSTPVRAVTKPDPLPPIGLRVVESRLGSNLLAWETNVEPDVARYRLLRQRADGRDPEVVATLDPGELQATDDAVGAGETVYYSVVVSDADGLVSEPSVPVVVLSEDYGLHAEAGPDGVHLAWNPRSAEGFQGARIFRHGLFRQRDFPPVAGSEFVDSSVEAGRSYRYSVALQRPDGLLAPRSRIVEVSIPEEWSRISELPH